MPTPDEPLRLATRLVAGELTRSCSPLRKKNNLFLMMGPPMVIPRLLKSNCCLTNLVGPTFRPVRPGLFQKLYTDPLNSLVPLLVTELIPAPVKEPNVTS